MTFVGLLAPVYFVPPALSSVFVGPRLLTVSAIVAAIVALMTYIIMPVLTYLAASWLCERPSRKSKDFVKDLETAAKFGGDNHE